MGFSISTNHLPRFRDFEHASRYERRVKPIRGKTIKPLGKRSAQHMQITRLNENTEQEAIACILYGTNCVTFYKDGRVLLNHGGYITQSTTKFIDCVYYAGRVEPKGGRLLFTHGGGTYAIPKEGLVIGKEGQLENVEPFKVHRVNRAAMKEVRARCRPFMDYCLRMAKLIDDWEPISKAPAYGPAEIPEGEDIEQWESSLREFLRGSVHREYLYERNNGTTAYKVKYGYSPALMNKHLHYAMCRQYRSTVFDEVTLPLGEYKRDAYARYFK